MPSSTEDRPGAAPRLSELERGVSVRNEFSAVDLVLEGYGRGKRLRVTSALFGTSAYLDATILEALSRMSRGTLQGLVSMALAEWDARDDEHASELTSETTD